jgi:hypothetical protein
MTTKTSTKPKGRDELKLYFSNDRQLSASYFAELIDSMLNRRDDQFHGNWQEGRTYRQGDVVIYEGRLWQRIAKEDACAHPDKNETPDKQPGWESKLVLLEKRVGALETKVADLEGNLKKLQQEFADFKQQVARFLSLIILGLGFFFAWLLISSVIHLFHLHPAR